MGEPKQRAADILSLQHQPRRCGSRASGRTSKEPIANGDGPTISTCGVHLLAVLFKRRPPPNSRPHLRGAVAKPNETLFTSVSGGAVRGFREQLSQAFRKCLG